MAKRAFIHIGLTVHSVGQINHLSELDKVFASHWHTSLNGHFINENGVPFAESRI